MKWTLIKDGKVLLSAQKQLADEHPEGREFKPYERERMAWYDGGNVLYHGDLDLLKRQDGYQHIEIDPEYPTYYWDFDFGILVDNFFERLSRKVPAKLERDFDESRLRLKCYIVEPGSKEAARGRRRKEYCDKRIAEGLQPIGYTPGGVPMYEFSPDEMPRDDE